MACRAGSWANTMTDRATIELSRDGESVTVVGSGELDLSISRELDTILSQASSSTHDVTIDLRGAIFIDSAILASLVKVGKVLKRDDARLKVIVTPGSHPQYVLRTVGFGALMDISTTDEE